MEQLLLLATVCMILIWLLGVTKHAIVTLEMINGEKIFSPNSCCMINLLAASQL